jgi:uncharacterized zinc-type alcohol dehydrogenase-like protein
MKVSALATKGPNQKLEPFSYEMGELGAEQVDVKVLNCGICHSDLSMMNNDWGMTSYPIVPGHEIIGEVIATGNSVKNIKVGDKVGVGWYSGSCMSCHECMDGSHHLCSKAEYTIGGRHGGFADYVRSHWSWAILLPEGI